jgi:hypothetical protein
MLSVSVAILSSLSLATGASALGLDVLSGGGSLTSGNGLLTFEDFEVTTNGSVGSDLSLYDVSALSDGIAITGPISAADGELGDLFIQFTVSSSSPITSASLRFNGVASGQGSSASVTETFDQAEDAQLFVFATGGGGSDVRDSVRFGEGYTSLRVSKDILVASSGGEDDCGEDRGRHLGWLIGKGHAKNHGDPDLKHHLGSLDGNDGGVAVISRIEQRFTVPEPATQLLIGIGFAGLAIARRRSATR